MQKQKISFKQVQELELKLLAECDEKKLNELRNSILDEIKMCRRSINLIDNEILKRSTNDKKNDSL